MTTNLGDILQSALDSDQKTTVADEIEAAAHREEIRRAAVTGAEFFKNLPRSVDAMGLLKVIDEFIGGEMGTEILRTLMGTPSMPVKYRVIEIPNFRGNTNKINAIKETRAVLNLGLKEAKDFVEGTIKLEMSGMEANELGPNLHAHGYGLRVS